MKRPPRHSVLLSECFFHSSLKLQISQAPWQPTSKILLLEERNFLSPLSSCPSPFAPSACEQSTLPSIFAWGEKKREWQGGLLTGTEIKSRGPGGAESWITALCSLVMRGEAWRGGPERQNQLQLVGLNLSDSLFPSWVLRLQKLRHTVDLTTILSAVTPQTFPSKFKSWDG